MQNITLNLYPTTSSSTATTSASDLQHQLYLTTKSNHQDQADDPDLWDILKANYQIRVNLTAPTLTFPGMEAHDPYSIMDKPSTSLIYLNNKEEKRVMYLTEIVKLCDATVERVLKEVKLKIFKSEPWKKPPLLVAMDDPNITMEEYIRLEEEKARRRAIVFNDTLTSEAALSCEPTVSSLNNDEIDFRISFDESDDEDCTVIFDKNSFSYKIISVNNLKTDSKNDNDKVNMPLLPSPKPTVSYFDDLDFFKDFENEFPAIVYNDAQTSKLDFLTEPILNPQHIDEFNLKDETSLSECDEEEQNVLNFNDLFPFNVIYPDELKTDTDNDNDKVDIEHSSGDLSVKPLPDVINTDVGAYAHGSNKLLETSHDTSNKIFKTGIFIKELNLNIMTCNYINKGMSFIFLIKNLYVPFGIPFDPKLFYKDESKLGQV
ncbi:hypothetical protein Tco_0359613 [Tanacetum coccineum]